MTRSARLWIVVALNIALVGALAIVGVATHSLGVIAEGVDYLADAAAIGVALFAIWLSSRPPTAERPRGYPTATSWSALITSGWLLILSVLIAAEASRRLVTGVHPVHGLPVLIVSAIAALAMVVGALILGGDADDADSGTTLAVRAVLLETAADAAIAAGVAIIGAVILASGGNYWLDPAVALAIAAVVAYHSLMLVRQVLGALRSSGGTDLRS